MGPGADRRERGRGPGRGADNRAASDGDAGRDESAPERLGGRQRRVVDRPARDPGAVDDQGRERGRLELVVGRAPPGGRAALVEVALVPGDPARDPPDAGRPERRRERAEVGRGQGRVAKALEHEPALPGRARAGALAQHLRADAVVRPEPVERGECDAELLVGRGGERARPVEAVDDPAGLQVERERAGLGARDAGDRDGAVESLAQRLRGGRPCQRREGGDQRRGDGERPRSDDPVLPQDTRSDRPAE